MKPLFLGILGKAEMKKNSFPCSGRMVHTGFFAMTRAWPKFRAKGQNPSQENAEAGWVR
jgi:hypothetical protein